MGAEESRQGKSGATKILGEESGADAGAGAAGGASMNSRDKGKRGERELAAILKEYGYNEARRGQQYCGADGSADVIGLPGIHIEAKRVEKLNLTMAMAQSMNDARPGEIPAVFHRKNHRQWLVTLTLDDFMKLYKAGGKEIEIQG